MMSLSKGKVVLGAVWRKKRTDFLPSRTGSQTDKPKFLSSWKLLLTLTSRNFSEFAL